MDKPKVGTIAWHDLTVPDAERVRDFYAAVVGWKPEPVEMGGYSDFSMIVPSTGEGAAGVCHARGTNADMPAQWMIYIIVEDADKAAAACVKAGGSIVREPRSMGTARYCVIRDPAGAVCALYAPGD